METTPANWDIQNLSRPWEKGRSSISSGAWVCLSLSLIKLKIVDSWQSISSFEAKVCQSHFATLLWFQTQGFCNSEAKVFFYMFLPWEDIHFDSYLKTKGFSGSTTGRRFSWSQLHVTFGSVSPPLRTHPQPRPKNASLVKTPPVWGVGVCWNMIFFVETHSFHVKFPLDVKDWDRFLDWYDFYVPEICVPSKLHCAGESNVLWDLESHSFAVMVTWPAGSTFVLRGKKSDLKFKVWLFRKWMWSEKPAEFRFREKWYGICTNLPGTFGRWHYFELVNLGSQNDSHQND